MTPYLQRLGVGLETRVGLYLERSLEMVIGLLGVLKAGGAYVPLDPCCPEQRLTFMLSDAQVAVILTQQQHALPLQLSELSARVVYLKNIWPVIAQESADLVPAGMQTANLATATARLASATAGLAYVIYTSGSTGQPKGVMISHRAIVNHMLWMQDAFPLVQAERVLQKTPFSFDASVWEFYAPLLSGACLVMARPGGHTDSAYLVATLATEQISTVQLVPTMLRALIDEPGLVNCRSLTRVFCGGEELTADLQTRCFAMLPPQAQLYNLYGPTECTVDASVWACEREDQRQRVPLGQPIAGTQFYLLDEQLQPVPTGRPGELFIGGSGLARGYLNRPELSAELFLPNPFSSEPGTRLYRTGDLARYHADGTLDYLGRLDQQVKLRGYRVELGEIETALGRHAAVRETVVLLREDTPGNQRLVAYIVPNSDQQPHPSELQRFLQPNLPQYMIPSTYLFLHALPQSANGKVDRRALASPSGPPLPPPNRAILAQENASVAPGNPLEETLAGIFAEVLGFEDVGFHDNFFALGGHSLLATQVISRVRDIFGVDLSLRELFDRPTIVHLAQQIEAARWAGERVQLPLLQPAPRKPGAPLPLSFAQQRLWFLDQLAPGNPFYTMPEAWLLEGELHVSVLVQSLNALVSRHEALRTRFIADNGRPSQLIEPVLRVSLPVVDLTGLSIDVQALYVERLRSDQARISFDLTGGPLLRTCLLRRSECTHLLLLTLHHIITDGWSMGILLRELTACYQAALSCESPHLPTLPIRYSDYALWQRQWLSASALSGQLAYWRQQLDGVPTILALPIDHARPSVQTYRGATHTFVLSPELIQTVGDLSRRAGVTLFMTLLAAFAVLLARCSGQDDLIIGTPIANRTRKEIEGVVGFFVNTLPLRLDLSHNPTFHALLARVREVALEAYANQDMPFERLVEELAPERSLSHTPLCQVFFALQNLPVAHLDLPTLRLQPLAEASGVAKCDLALELTRPSFAGSDIENGVVGRLTYCPDLFEPATIERLASHYQTLLTALVNSPDEYVAYVPLLSAFERHTLLSAWNATEREYPHQWCVHELFEQQAQCLPDAIALACGDEHVTYDELNRRANALAYCLRERGIVTESLVAVCMSRTPAMVMCLLGILKAGAAYLPLDPTYPAERLTSMLAAARVPLVLTTSALSHTLIQPQARACTLLALDSDPLQALLARHSTSNCPNTSLPDNLVYVIYTSGSTGQPKGVQITQRGLLNLVCWHQHAFALTPWDRTTHLASSSFDAAAWELWPSLAAGATICLVNDEVRTSPLQLRDWLLAQQITVSFVPTPLAEPLLDADWPADTALRALLTGGDLLHRAPLTALPFVLVNNYGPTESTVVTTSGIIAPTPSEERPTIGRPIANTRLYVLDTHLQPVPIGTPGELYIGGAGLARGYLHRPDLTAERFLPDPFSHLPGAHLYKSGDLVRYLSDGRLDFLGRTDAQVKIRGFRVEPGEIEALLRQHASIREAIVLVREDTAGDKRLVAYIVPESDMPLTLQQLRQYLQNRLPHYMLPAAIVTLEQMPLSPNGKLDRWALPAPEVDNSHLAEQYVAPRTSIEKTLTSIWAELLGTVHIGVYDNFFELGGHSLLATQVISRIKSVFHVDLSVRSIFEQPCVAELAQSVSQMPHLRIETSPALTMDTANGDTANGQTEATNRQDVEGLLAQLHTLSVEEVDALLSSMLSQQNGAH